jgi:hypothetical protein
VCVAAQIALTRIRFCAVIIAWSDNVPMECAADLFAIFFDGSLGAYLDAAVLNNFNAVNNQFFSNSHNNLRLKSRLTIYCVSKVL